jgi:putative flippase GtrA
MQACTQLPRGWRYLAIAAICAIVTNVFLITLVRLGINYLVALWIGYVPVLLLAYGLHTSITFQVDRTLPAFLRYALVTLANYPLWIGSLFFLRGILKLPIEYAAPIGTIVAFIGNYLAAHWAILRSVRAAFSSFSANR